jgi:hypothetical protein
MTDHQIINLLGGATHLATILKLSTSGVHNWKSRGIPWRWRVPVVALAKKRGVVLPGDFLTRENENG